MSMTYGDKILAFAKKYVLLTPKDCEKWIFSDECPLNLFLTPSSQNSHKIYINGQISTI